ncbi:MAG: cytidine deaminase [Clostridia bacterium]|nr:cytidine deaminase [Clostridia bacterium]
MTDRELFMMAEKAREKSYSPYSDFAVGAALLCRDGTVFTGANIENAAYSPSVCAERVAIFSAVHAGKREFEAIAVVGGKRGEKGAFCPPCGVCRQVMAEFCGGDLKVILGDEKETKAYALNEILPLSFTKNDLEKKP